jgi:hypothetical protein
MDQDSTKDGAGGGDRRNWRERLGVGQGLPKISDEFDPPQGDVKPAEDEARSDAKPGEDEAQARSDAKPGEDEAQTGARSAPRPGTPVARPAPMAPRYGRSTAPRPGNGSSSGEETQGANPAETVRFDGAAPGLNAWAAPSQPARDPGNVSHPPSSTRTPASDTARPAPSRASAYPQAAQRSGAAPASTGDSFGERLRAQREAAEKLAQQRLAAARDRSGRASADALTILAPHKPGAAPQSGSQPQPEPSAKPAAGDQPRFTFAQEEIFAAQQETAFTPAPAAGGQQQAADPARVEARSAPGPGVHYAPAHAPDPHAPAEPKLHSEPAPHNAGAPEYMPEYIPEYRHEDDAMFEDEQPTFEAVPPRASAEDYSAAYREFEDEFEDEPRRRSGPLLLLVSLAALAVVSGGVIYWYQQMESAPPAAATTNLPVIAAPEEPAKAEPPPQQELQQAAAPTTRKQIYDRIIGEETLEPERIVPTEEAPLRQIQQPQRQQPRASEAGQDDQSGEPLPLPLPPPPGTGVGEQGDLLVPGAATIQTASAEPEPAPARLSLPEPERAADPGRHPADGGTIRAAAREPAPEDAAPAKSATSPAVKLRGTAAGPEAPEAPVSSRASIYPEVTEPLAYPNVRAESRPPHDQSGEPEASTITALPERQAEPQAEQETAPVAERVTAPEPEADQVAEAEPEPDVEQASDVPLPKAKPEPPARVTTAARQAPAPQRQAAAPASSGPVQIIPTDESQAPVARAAQPEAQSATPRRRTVGREPDPLAGPGSTFASSLSASLDSAPSQQVASVAPGQSTQPQPTPSQPTQAGPTGEYVVQLASFRSEAEALSAYQRLAQRHPQLVGNLASRVNEASLGQSGSFYRLGVGPLSNRTEAAKLCNALIAAGEKDCLVRRN